ncbi:hypothetical protein Q0590_24860 [Rhodocytophaga aerolata]|uniref:Uncharacterized protein n=1 Tax=Rhodocytophaga aerolata TaxID=455078 RepID=A0ABT8RCU7_9BACT|nr:hypothetical protein [Rhodocytophaga aerolata]MDO1449531.1 hypothetical protein [Rhodocytophaga aerolata]
MIRQTYQKQPNLENEALFTIQVPVLSCSWFGLEREQMAKNGCSLFQKWLKLIMSIAVHTGSSAQKKAKIINLTTFYMIPGALLPTLRPKNAVLCSHAFGRHKKVFSDFVL